MGYSPSQETLPQLLETCGKKDEQDPKNIPQPFFDPNNLSVHFFFFLVTADASGGEVLTYGSCVSLSTKQDQAVDKDLYLHTDISHATKAYARAFRTDAEGDSHELRSGSIGNIHTIAFQIVPPHDFRARKALRQELLNRKTWEEKQIDRETA